MYPTGKKTMNADEVKARVEHDVQGLLEHKDEIEKLVVLPSTETFQSMDGDDRRFWIVGRGEEYYITFDESSGRYGLAFKNILGLLVYLGEDGGIADAYLTLTTREEENDNRGRKSFKPSRRNRGYSRK
jgi:hypothetical protein